MEDFGKVGLEQQISNFRLNYKLFLKTKGRPLSTSKSSLNNFISSNCTILGKSNKQTKQYETSSQTDLELYDRDEIGLGYTNNGRLSRKLEESINSNKLIKL